MSRRPDVLIASGDLVDAGSDAQYELLADLLDPLPLPVYLIPGNHDEREAMRRVLRRRGHDYLPEAGFLHYTVDLGPLRLVALDTVVAGAPGGELCEERLAWLEQSLAASDKPTLVMQHHPPFATGMVRMDAMGLSGAAAEEAIIARHPQVERVLCGHLHRSILRRFGGTLAMTIPSTAMAVELDLRAEGRLAVLAEPPACALHLWQDGQLVSHQSPVGDYGAPHVVSE
jgi:3',5'-cyclic AMP phosphodiesterase CpdA